MAKIETIYFRGPVMFPWVTKPQTPEWEPEGYYSVDIGLTSDDVKKVKSWSHLYKAKTYKEPYNEDVDPSLEYFHFKRMVNGKHPSVSGPIPVLDADGNPWNDEENGFIGNGSILTVKLSVYHGRSAKGQDFKKVTLAGVRVDELREFKRDDEGEVYDEPIAYSANVESGVNF